MNRQSYLTLFVAVCCIGAAGVSSTTLNSTLTQTPDDVVDFDYSKLPLGVDQGRSVKGAVQQEEGSPGQAASGGDSQQDDSQSGSKGEDSSSGGGASESQGDPQESDSQPGEQSGGGEASGDSGASDSKGENAASKAASGRGTGVQELTPLQQLLQLLKDLLPLLVLVIALALLYRYRDHLLALVAAVLAVARGEPDREQTSTTQWPSEQPSNEVHRAWLSMVSKTGIDDPRTRTPSECAAAAIDADLDPSAVRTLTGVFEEVRYGDKPVTEERRQRAREGLEGLGRGGAT